MTSQQINVLCGLLVEESLENLKDKVFKALFRQGYEGVQAIIDLANKDYNSNQSYLLTQLCRTKPVKKLILIPSMIVSLNSKEAMKKLEILAGLN